MIEWTLQFLNDTNGLPISVPVGWWLTCKILGRHPVLFWVEDWDLRDIEREPSND